MSTMRLLFYPILLVSFVSLGQQPTYKKVWESSADFAKPYSVIYDSLRHSIYVSNMNLTPMDSEFAWEKRNDGFISKLSATGELISLKWIDGLTDPAGMFIQDNLLFVADGEFLLIVDIAKGKVMKRISAQKLVKKTPESLPVHEENSKAPDKVSPPPAHLKTNMLTAITGSPDGSIFVRDSGYKSIYKWKDNQLTHLMDDDRFGGDTEIMSNDEEKAIWVVAYSSIIKIYPDDKSSMRKDMDTPHAIVGIAKMKNFHLLVTSFDEVYRYQYSELTELFKAAEPCKCHTDIEVEKEEILVLDSKLNKLMSFRGQ